MFRPNFGFSQISAENVSAEFVDFLFSAETAISADNTFFGRKLPFRPKISAKISAKTLNFLPKIAHSADSAEFRFRPKFGNFKETIFSFGRNTIMLFRSFTRLKRLDLKG